MRKEQFLFLRTGTTVVHKGEVIVPAPVVKQVGGPLKIVKFMEIGCHHLKV